MSAKYEFNSQDFKKIGKVMLWSVGSTIAAVLIIALGDTNIPVQWLFLVPIVNTLLVAAKKFFEDKLE